MALAVILAAAAPAGESPPSSWPQWGGPARDFLAPARGLAAAWPEEGPRRLWSRELGDGYSAIVAENGRLYTMYREADREVVICMDAATGETIWERRYEDPPRPGQQHGYGDGPRSTPLIAGDLLFTIGITGKMHALRKADGSIVWSRELWGPELDGTFLGHGYSSSPLAYRDTVIAPVGGEQGGLVAFDRQDGAVRWRSTDFRNSFSSPRILEIVGEPQILLFMAEELIAVDPDDGRLRWRYPHANQWKHNISMPVAAGGDAVFLSSPQAGARGLRLSAEGASIRVEEAWSSRRIQLYHVSSVQDGDWVYGSSGAMAVTFLVAVNIRTGEIGWRERGFAKANCVAADGRLVILDEDGVLYLATATPEKLVVHSRTQLLEPAAWTVPTIVGDTLYARDRRRVLAVSLG